MEVLRQIYVDDVFVQVAKKCDLSAFGQLLESDVGLCSVFGLALTRAIYEDKVNEDTFDDGLPVPDWCECHSQDKPGSQLHELVSLLLRPGWHVVIMDQPNAVFGGYCDGQHFHFFTGYLSSKREVKSVPVASLQSLFAGFKTEGDWDKYFHAGDEDSPDKEVRDPKTEKYWYLPAE